MQNESLGKSFYSFSFNFQKFQFHSLSVNQSHNNQTNNQIIYLFITFQNLEFWDVTISPAPTYVEMPHLPCEGSHHPMSEMSDTTIYDIESISYERMSVTTT